MKEDGESMVSSTSFVDTSVVAGVEDKAAKMTEEHPASPGTGGSVSGGDVAAAAGQTSGYSSDSSTEVVDVSKMDPATLSARIKGQVEYYFSQQNLNRDVYMKSQMNAEGFIPVATIASFKKVRNLTEDVEAIADAVADSTICELNEDKTMIKTSWRRPARTTIILREVPEQTTEEDIKGLFDDKDYSVVSARSDVGQTWFVTMDTEDNAKDAMLHLLSKMLHGQMVKARLKSEALRPVAPQASAPAFVPPQQAGMPAYGYPYRNMNYPVYGGNAAAGGWGFQVDQATQVSMSQQHANGMVQTRDGSTQMNRRSSGGPGQGDKRIVRSGSSGGATGKYPRRSDRQMGSSGAAPGAHAGPRQGKKPGKSAPGAGKRPAPKTPVFDAQDFPSLPMGKSGPGIASSGGATDSTKASGAPVPVTETAEKATQSTVSEDKATETAPLSEDKSESAAPAVPVAPKPTNSWAAAAAKAPAAPAQTAPAQSKPKVPAAAAPVPFKPVAAAPALERNPFYSQQEQQQHMQEALTAAAPKPAAERPKRGWEKPDLVPKSAAVATGKTSVQDVVSESVKVSTGKTQEGTSSPAVAKPLAAAAGGARQPTVEQDAPTKEPAADAGGDTAAESDKELLKTAFGKWGSKKSFAEVIKAVPATAGEVDVTSANGEARAGGLHMERRQVGNLQTEGSSNRNAPLSSSTLRKPGEVEGNWRTARRS